MTREKVKCCDRLVPLMNTKARSVMWVAFWSSAVLTGSITSRLWMWASYELVLSLLAIISVSLGIWVLMMNRFSWRSVLLVALGLVIGQWWLTEKLIFLLGGALLDLLHDNSGSRST